MSASADIAGVSRRVAPAPPFLDFNPHFLRSYVTPRISANTDFEGHRWRAAQEADSGVGHVVYGGKNVMSAGPNVPRVKV